MSPEVQTLLQLLMYMLGAILWGTIVWVIPWRHRKMPGPISWPITAGFAVLGLMIGVFTGASVTPVVGSVLAGMIGLLGGASGIIALALKRQDAEDQITYQLVGRTLLSMCPLILAGAFYGGMSRLVSPTPPVTPSVIIQVCPPATVVTGTLLTGTPALMPTYTPIPTSRPETPTPSASVTGTLLTGTPALMPTYTPIPTSRPETPTPSTSPSRALRFWQTVAFVLVPPQGGGFPPLRIVVIPESKLAQKLVGLSEMDLREQLAEQYVSGELLVGRNILVSAVEPTGWVLLKEEKATSAAKYTFDANAWRVTSVYSWRLYFGFEVPPAYQFIFDTGQPPKQQDLSKMMLGEQSIQLWVPQAPDQFRLTLLWKELPQALSERMMEEMLMQPAMRLPGQ